MSIELMERALEFITGVHFGEHGGSSADREKLEADLTTAIQQAETQQPATAIACGIPGMAKTTCPYCEQGFAFEHEQPATGEPVAWRNVIPGGRKTDEWESTRIADYNLGWNAYRKAAKTALEHLETSTQPLPSAWMYTLEYGGTIADTKVSLRQLNYPFGVCGADYLRENSDGISYMRQTPLYTHPAPIVPTTPEPVDHVGDRADMMASKPAEPVGVNQLRKELSDANDFIQSLADLCVKYETLLGYRKTKAPEGASELAEARGESNVNTELDLAMPDSICDHVFVLDPKSSIRICNKCGTVECKKHTHPAPSVPEGYALVPIEPTQAMMNVQTWDFSSFYSPREIWAAMLAAKDTK